MNWAPPKEELNPPRDKEAESREIERGNFTERLFCLHLIAAGFIVAGHRYQPKTCPKRPELSLRANKGTLI